MKKLLSIILAGALALTAVSPVFAATSDYENSRTDGLYYDVDFSKATGVAEGDSLAGYISTASNSELFWENRGGGNAITKVEDPIMGTVAKITTGGTLQPRIWLKKGNHKNAFDNTVATNSTIFEFSFKVADNYTSRMYFRDYDNEPNSGDFPYFYFETDGSIVGKRSGTVADAFKTNGEWNHVVIEYATVAASGAKSNTVYVWVNGVQVGYNGASDGAVNFSSDTWTETYLAFCAADDQVNGVPVQDIYISNFTKYELAEGVKRYKPADAGNAPATITSTSEDVTVDEASRAINYEEGVTTDDLVAALAGADTFYIATAEDVEKDSDMFTEDDYPIADITNIITVSASGDVLKYYSVAPMEALTIEVGEGLTADHDARTIVGKVTDFPTVADLKEAIEVTAGNPDFIVYAGDAEAEDTAAATTVTSIYFESETAKVKKTYTVTIRTAEKVFYDLDMKDYADQTIKDGVVMGNVWVRDPGKGTYAVVDDAELGHKVILAKHTGANWIGIQEASNLAVPDVASGDYLIFEALVKMPEDVSTGPLFAHRVALAEFKSDGTIDTMNGAGLKWETGKWYHVVVQFKPTDTACNEIYTWINGEQAGTTYWPRSDANSKISYWKAMPATSHVSLRASVAGAGFYVSKYKMMRSNDPYDEVANGDVATLTDATDGSITVNESLKTVLYDDEEMAIADFVAAVGKPDGATVIVYSDDEPLGDEEILADATSVLVRSASGNRVERYSLISKTASTPEVTWDVALTVDEVGKTVAFKETNIKTVADLKAKVTAGSGTTVTYKDSTGAAIADDTASTTTVATITVSKGSISYDYTVTVTAATKTYVNYDWYLSDTNIGSGGKPLKLVHDKTMTQVMDDDMGYTVAHIDWVPNKTLWGGLITNGNNTVGGDLVSGDKFVVETTIKVDECNVLNNPCLTMNKGSLLYAKDSEIIFDFGYYSAHNTIDLLGGAFKVPYEADKWYHIVAEYTTTDDAGSTVNMWINGEQVVTNYVSSTLTPSLINSRMNTDECFRLMQAGASTEAMKVTYSIAQYSWYRSDFGYDADAQAKDAAALTEESDAITLDATLGTIALGTSGLKVSDLKAALTAPTGATVRYLDADGAEVADTADASTVKKIVSVSSQKTQAIKYTVAVPDTASDAYTVNYADMTIEGVWNQTTEAIFREKITVDGAYTVNMAGKYLADGDTVVTANNTFTVKLEALAHHTGTATSGSGTNYANEDGIHIALKNGTIESVTTDAMQGANDAVLKLTHSGINDFRIVMEEYDNSNGGTTAGATYTKGMVDDEVRNIEFAFMAPTGAHNIRVQMDQNTAIIIKDGVFYSNPDATTVMPYTYTPGEWMHIGVSGTRLDAGTDPSQTKFKLYINGEYACQLISTTGFSGTAGGSTGVKVAGGTDVVTYLDDIKYYRSATWGIDYDYYYGTIAESASDDVVLANGDAWLANGATVASAFPSTTLYAADGSVVAAADLEAGDSFFVKEATNCIFKKFTVKEGTLGAAIAADGTTLTATVGMVADSDSAAMFVAGIDDDGKFTNIVKLTKNIWTDDEITYDLNNINDSKIKVYIWDSSLRTLADVAEFVKANDVWSAVQ